MSCCVFQEAYSAIEAIGQAVATKHGYELCDEWPNLVMEWLNKVKIDSKNLGEDDVQAAFEALEFKQVPIVPKVGMGATVCFITDRHAATIVEVSPSGLRVVTRRDKSRRTDNNGMSESQSHIFVEDSNGETETFSLRKNGLWVREGSKQHHGPTLHIGDRRQYYDYSF